MIVQVVQGAPEKIQMQFYSDGSPVTPSSVTIDIERLDGISIASGLSLATGLGATAGSPCYATLSGTQIDTLGQHRIKWHPIIDGIEYQQYQYFEVVTAKTQYGSERDVRELLSDIPLPEGRDISRYIKRAEARVDAYLAELYEIPVDITASGISNSAVELLQAVTTDLAAGYLLLSLATVQENDLIHAYGQNLIDRAIADLEKIKNQEMVLDGATASSTTTRGKKILESAADGSTTAQDSESYFGKSYEEMLDKTEQPDEGVLEDL